MNEIREFELASERPYWAALDLAQDEEAYLERQVEALISLSWPLYQLAMKHELAGPLTEVLTSLARKMEDR